MITTILAYSIFITNPTGTLGPHQVSRDTPYFFYEESHMREYKTAEECEATAAQVRNYLAERADELFKAANNAQKHAQYIVQKAKYQSLKCLAVERNIDTDHASSVETAKDASENFQGARKPSASTTPSATSPKAEIPKEQLIAFRIGRIDSENRFYGTIYNTTPYPTMQACHDAFEKTKKAVVLKVVKDGATEAVALDILNQVKAKYACHQVIVDAANLATTETDNPASQKPMATVSAAMQPVPNQQATQTAQPLGSSESAQNLVSSTDTAKQQLVPQIAATQPNGYAQASGQQYPALPHPRKKFFVSELVLQPNGTYARVIYEGGYASVPLCTQALNAFLKLEIEAAQSQYGSDTSPYAFRKLSERMHQIEKKRQHMACVS